MENVTDDDHTMQYEEQKYAELARCQCFKDRFPSQVTRYQAISSVQREFTKKDMIVSKASYIEGSPLGKYVEIEGNTSSIFGNVTLRLKAYLQKTCLFAMVATSLTASSETPRALAFLNSVRNPSATRSLPVANPLPQSNDAASRLKALKDLLDQKLITPAQYEAKRQAIIDGM